ncbi:MAG: hypothetical protein CVU54_18875 [Deltaproteobacteria bacterium HGW-Deltaproteobacteria-12]|nr:MAG: hypothetical protein CVU54_18875 [Deltaproteobacteria bacterium HGW-Deltaproteobacteria-12]
MIKLKPWIQSAGLNPQDGPFDRLRDPALTRKEIGIKNKYWKLSMNIAKDFIDILVSRENK